MRRRRRLAFAGITGAVRYTSSDAIANYNGLQASLRQRPANGLEFLASYTYSKALGDNPGFYGPGWGGYSASSPNTGLGGDGNYNWYDMMLDYGPLWFSARHNLTFAGTYELPIGKDRAIGADWGDVTQALLGGWNVSEIVTIRSGPARHDDGRLGPRQLAPEQRLLLRAARRRSRRRSAGRQRQLGQIPERGGVPAGGARNLR